MSFIKETAWIARHKQQVEKNSGKRPTLPPTVIVETPHLMLREMTPADYDDLCEILQDEQAMYAYAHAFSQEECRAWLQNQFHRYETYGFGLWAVLEKETGAWLGQCGLTLQDWNGDRVLEVGYLFKRRYWHHGYATEAAKDCMDYAFDVLQADEVCSIIRDNNFASQAVAKRNGLVPFDTMVKHYYHIDMPHIRFLKRREN